MKTIVFHSFGSNHLVGGFAPGDVARVGADLARHLVDEIKVAQYQAQPEKPADPPKKTAKKAEK